MKSCTIKAKGCLGTKGFWRKDQYCCSNPACQKERNYSYRKLWLRNPMNRKKMVKYLREYHNLYKNVALLALMLFLGCDDTRTMDRYRNNEFTLQPTVNGLGYKPGEWRQ